MPTVTPRGQWQAGLPFPPLSQASSLHIYDLRAASPACRLSFACLSGLVNRGPAKIYALQHNDDEFWLQELDQALPRVSAPEARNPFRDLLEIYGDLPKGLVIYDPALPATINVASTLASLHTALVVSPEQGAELSSLPILFDLRRFAWKTPLQAYAWAYRELLPACSQNMLAGIDPGISGSLRSFLVAHRVFTCWLDTRHCVPVPSQNWLSERRLFKQILADFSPGSLHLGWFIHEPSGIRLTSRAALLTLASDHCTNLEVWSGLSAPLASSDEIFSTLARKDPTPGTMHNSSASATPADTRRTSDTTYLSFTVSDGDNLQYCQHFLLRLWNSPARGSLPIGWTIAPALRQTMPRLAEFYRRTASENDEFIAGPSGAAYMLPARWPRSYHEQFLQLTADYMQDMHLSVLQVLDASTPFSMKFLNPRLQKLFVERLHASGLRGILSGAGSFAPSWQQRTGLPIYQNVGLAFHSRRALRLIRRASRQGVRFINVYIFAWKITPDDLQKIVEELGEGFTLVTPGRLLALIQQSEGASPP